MSQVYTSRVSKEKRKEKKQKEKIHTTQKKAHTIQKQSSKKDTLFKRHTPMAHDTIHTNWQIDKRKATINWA